MIHACISEDVIGAVGFTVYIEEDAFYDNGVSVGKRCGLSVMEIILVFLAPQVISFLPFLDFCCTLCNRSRNRQLLCSRTVHADNFLIESMSQVLGEDFFTLWIAGWNLYFKN